MADRPNHDRAHPASASFGLMPAVSRFAASAALVLLLGGCASFGNSTFVDPAKYELYNCQQLTAARAGANNRIVELEGLMAKAETGAAGTVVSGLAYQTDYVATKADRDAIDLQLARNNCAATTATTTVAPATAAPAPPGRRKR